MPTETNKVRDVLVALVAGGVDYVVCGGLACVLQGVNRVTHDLDLDIALDAENLERFLAVARARSLRPRVPEPLESLADPARRKSWVEEKQAVVFTLVSERGDLVIDVFLQYPIPHDELRDAADPFEIGGVRVAVSSKADLLRAKRAVQPPRKQDLRDIEDLEELLRGT